MMTRILLATLFSTAVGAFAQDPHAAVRALMERNSPGLSQQVVLEAIPAAEGGKDRYQLDANGSGALVLRGNSPLSLACAYREAMEASGGYSGWFSHRAPSSLTAPAALITRQSPYRHRNYLNICATSYTQAYWDWSRWEKEIDLMSMRGFTQCFVIPGHHKVWRNTLRRIGYSESDIKKFLPAPSHAAWWLLGNLEGEGGPMPDEFIEAEAQLGRQIADRMRSLGVEPIVFGFFGMVPTTFKNYFPTANVVAQGKWGGFDRPAVLDPTSAKFAEIAAIWYEELGAVYGPVRYHAGDLFHEGGTAGNLNVTQCATAVQQAMRTANPNATWVIESWQSNPSSQLLAGTDPAWTLVQQLDLDQVTGTRSGNLRAFDGRPWIWCEINNFGGNHGLYGGLPMLAKLPQTLLNKPALGQFQGLGFWSEAIETNPVYFDLFTDMFWRDTPVDLNAWIAAWVTKRYGAANGPATLAWQQLASTIYNVPNAQEGVTDFVIGARPGPNVVRARTWCANNDYWHPTDVISALDTLLGAGDQLGGNDAFRHDLVDVTRQVFNDYSFGVYKDMMAAYQGNDAAAFEAHAARFLRLFDRLDRVLATMPGWRLGSWTSLARGKSGDPAFQNQLETTARQLVTTWERGSAWGDINDYSSRGWAGLVKDYYKHRWEIYVGNLRAKLAGTGNGSYTGGSFEQSFRSDFSLSFSPAPEGDAVTTVRGVWQELAGDIRAQANKAPLSLNWALDPSGPDRQVFSFDVNRVITRVNGLKATFQWKSGNNALEIHRVDLLRNGVVVSSDVHEGRTGVANTANIYTVHAAEVAAGDVWTLRVEVSGWGGKNSNGDVELAAIPYGTTADYVGRWQYSTGGSTYVREWRTDGTCVLYQNGAVTPYFNGYTWDVVNGVLRLKDPAGNVTQTHTFGATYQIIGTPYGPASRITATSACRTALQSAGLANVDPSADPDGDGFSNLIEWACGTATDRMASFPKLGISEGGTTLEFGRRLQWQVEGLRYLVEASATLGEASWSELPLLNVTATVGANGYETVKGTPSPLGKNFYRLRVLDPWAN